MGAILCDEFVDARMAELTLALGHGGTPDRSRQRPCARCGAPRGRGHKWCEACRTDGRKEYNQDYHRRTYSRKPPAEVSATRRTAVGQRWSRHV